MILEPTSYLVLEDKQRKYSNYRRSWLILGLLIFSVVSGIAQTTYYSRSGQSLPMDWDLASNWTLISDGSGPAAAIPGQNDNVVILAGHTILVDNVTDNGGAGISADALGLANVGAGMGGSTFPSSGSANFFHNGDMTVQEGATLTFATRVMFDGTVFIAGTLDTNADIITLGNFYFSPTASFSSLDDLILTGNSNTRIDIPNAADSFTNDDIYLDHTDAFVCGLGILNIGQSGGAGHIINLRNSATLAQICTVLQITGCSPDPPGTCPAGTGVFSPTPGALTGTGGSFIYTENDITVIDAGIGLTYGEPFMTSASITVSSGYIDGEDELVLPPISGILSNFDTATGVLTLTGYGTIPVWEAVLNTITYENLSDNPTVVTRTIQFVITDGFSISNTISRDITIQPVNDPPDVSTISGTPTPLAYTEGDGAVNIDDQITLADPDDVNLEGATVFLTNYVMGEDFVDFVDNFGVSKVGFDALTGILTLTGSATLANYELALRSVTYENTNSAPDLTTRVANFVVNDGDADSPPFTRDIDISAINSAPIISGTMTDLTYTEGDGVVIIDNVILVSDPDNLNIASASITISANFQGAEDVLDFNDQNGIVGNFVSGVMTLTGSASISFYQAAIRSITYENTSENPNSATRTITFIINDGALPSSPFDRDILLVPVNDIPLVTGTLTALAYTEGDGTVVFDNALAVSDVDNTNLSSATLSISTNYQTTEDVLSFTDQNGITGSFLAGVLTLTGSATLADYQTALRSVTYENTSLNPNTATRTVSVVINDGAANSLVFDRDITISPVNDAPSVLGSITALAYTEGDGPELLDNALTVIDIDNTTLSSALISFTANFQAAEDVLAFVDQNGITGVFSGSVLTLTGVTSLANYQTALQSITYENTSENPSSLPRTVGVIVNDGALPSTSFNRDITVAPVNDAAIVNGTLTDLAYTEGDGAVLFDDALAVSDVDNVNLTSATLTISANFQAAEDVLAFADQNGITGSFLAGVLTLTGSATLANYQTALRTITYENTSGNPNIATRTVTLIVNDGIDPSPPFDRDITITPLNNVPIISGSLTTLVYVEGDGAVLLDNSIAVSDTDNTNLASATISISANFQVAEDVLIFVDQNSITGSFVAGVLTLTGSASLADYQAALRSITYENTSQDPDPSTRTVSIIINDGTDPSTNFDRDISIAPVNDTPNVTGTLTALVYTEGDGAVLFDDGLTTSDVDNVNLSLATISFTANFQAAEDILAFTNQNGITGNFTAGILTLSGSALMADYQTALRSITYENTSVTPNTLTRTVAIIINDGSLDSNPFEREITVSAVNSPPEITGTLTDLNYTEGDGAVPLDNAILVSDIDNTSLVSATISISNNFVSTEDQLVFVDQNGISGNFASGMLTLSGAATLADYQMAIGSITYENTSSNPNTTTRTVSYTVNDGIDNSTLFNRDILITAVDSPPVVTGTGSPLMYTEGDGAVLLDNLLTLLDTDSPNLASATVTIANNFQPTEDVLSFTNQNGITGNFTAGTLTLTGSATLGNYVVALRSITYENTSDNPTLTDRTVSFVIDDGNLLSTAFNRDIVITPVNDLPLISGSASPLNYTEGDGSVAIDNSIVISDIDNSSMSSATITFTANYQISEDILAFANQNGITGSFNSGVLSLSGSSTLANYQAALRSVTYENTSTAPSTSTRTLAFIINDGTDNSLPFAKNISITPIVEPPVIGVSSSTGTSIIINYTEGDGIVTLDNTFSISDGDDLNLEGAQLKFSSNYVENQDVLGFEDQLGITSNFNSSTGTLILTGTATVVNYQTAVRNITYENTSENPSSSTRTILLTVNDGDTDSNSIIITLNVIPVNDAPVISGTGSDLIYQESSGQAAIDVAILTSDVDNQQLASATVTLSNNYQAGEDILDFIDQLGISSQFDVNSGILTLSGMAPVGDYEIALQSVTYENTESIADLSRRTVEFIVNDGVLSSTAFTRDIIIEEVEDQVVVYQVVTPDGDSFNDTWVIDGIEQYPNNNVSIFNRWNSLVYRQTGYDNQATGWAGDANEGLGKGELPDGTYFYTVDLGDGSNIMKGFLVLKRK